jgi:hypothetical protein
MADTTLRTPRLPELLTFAIDAVNEAVNDPVLDPDQTSTRMTFNLYAVTLRRFLIAATVYPDSYAWQTDGAYNMDELREVVEHQYTRRLVTAHLLSKYEREFRPPRKGWRRLRRPAPLPPQAHWALHRTDMLASPRAADRTTEDALPEAAILESPVIAEAAGFSLREVPLRVQVPGISWIVPVPTTRPVLEAALTAWIGDGSGGPMTPNFIDVLGPFNIAAGL